MVSRIFYVILLFFSYNIIGMVHSANLMKPPESKCLYFEDECDNGECIDGEYTCNGKKDCSDGSDETKEKCNHLICPIFTFKCDYGACIDQELICDGKKDCSDGSDETEKTCENYQCNHYDFQCNYGACVSKSLQCNGMIDCIDGSDEKNCKDFQCLPNKFQCDNGICIDEWHLCNGKKDCSDGSDETNKICNGFQCQPNQFQCDYGACIRNNSRCDLHPDCADDSDEKECEQQYHECTIPNNISADIFNPFDQTTTMARPGSKIIEGVLLTLNCSETTIPYRTLFSCLKTKWLPYEPQCFSYCKPIEETQDNHLKIKCKDKSGNKVVCDDGFEVYSIELACDTSYKSTAIDENPIRICRNGNWNLPINITCTPVLCPAIKETQDNHLKVKCRDESGNDVSCELPFNGYSVELACDIFSENAAINENPYRICNNGSWDLPTNLTCTPVCGQKFVQAKPLVIGGTVVEKEHYPWTVGIYDSSYMQICGGALLNMRLVVSAAHCFDKERSTDQLNPSDYHVAAGKHYRQYNHSDDKYAEYGEIELIEVSNLYRKYELYFQGDIAIVVLKKSFNISIAIRPVCLDRDNAFEAQDLVDGNMGTTIGWGYTTEYSSPSDVLKELTAPYYPENKCKILLSPELKLYYTPDKLCVGWVNASQAICKGDSGGALVFLSTNGLYFIRGIVSISPKNFATLGCDSNTITLFTKVSKHLDFIKNLESKYRP